jgi:outer membrane receptor protein involved in Fe transport
MGSVEVLRGPSTTFYGSGALGGVVEISPAEFAGWSVAAGYETNGDENYQSFGYGTDEWSAGFAMRRAGEGEAADGDPLNTGFTQYSGVFRWNRKARGKRYEITFLPSYGQDIGKSNTDFPERTTTYPRERHGLLRFSIDSDRDWRFLSFVHAQDLRTEVAEDELQSDIFTEAVDLGLRWEGKRGAGSAELRYGADLFARRNVNAREVRQDFSDDSVVTQESLDDAQGTERGAFASSHWDRGKTKWEIGGRYSHIEQENGGAPERKRNAASGYGGVSRELGDGFELRGGISSGLRFPSLSEQFFSGTTGRGEVIGNPRLDDERSLSLEASLRWIGKSVVIKGDLFRNEISDYIERIEIAPDVLTFVNLTSGTIRGAELQGVAHLGKPWNLSFGGHLIDGESDDGNPLADIPPDEFYIGGTRRSGRFTLDGRLTLRDRIDDPGSGEKPIPSAQLLAIAVTYRWAESWSWTVGGANLLDEDYFLSADSKAALAAGRTFYVQIRRRL